ncbi:CotH kinase family protein [uncultured Fibrobacter sp.]|uniref:CotH kinase family protein n=1 Tax=uncultured Fibrobacter sp. TaxID=261512 RepID=UPI0026003BE1|nr:CotH kinase family protein [uncultured Fibrobacter sp.]
MDCLVRRLAPVIFAGVLVACSEDPVGVDAGVSVESAGSSDAMVFEPVYFASSTSMGEVPAEEPEYSYAEMPTVGVSSSSSSANPMPNNGVPYIRILVDDASVLSRTDSLEKPAYIGCTIEVAGNGIYADVPMSAAKIKQRGNSTRLWYDKKPYRIKFQEKTEMLGLAANKDWVLLANFRDPTNLMNALAFDIAREMGSFNFVNANRFVEVEINGDYKGLYQLTEQIEQAESRVNVGADGVLLSLDQDDGPELSPDATDNFWSATYKLPVAVKYPKTLAEGSLEQIRSDFKRLEDAIASADYDAVKALLDVRSFMDFLILQEITRNVELEAPRSMYLHRASAESKYVFGPVWDFDGGFGYSWNEETKEYFSSQSWILGSTNPSGSPFNCTADMKNDWGMCAAGASGGRGGFGANAWDGSGAAGLFTSLFSNAQFLAEYKARWAELAPKISALVSERLNVYLAENAVAMANDAERWPWPESRNNTGKNSAAAARDLEAWMQKRISDYSAVVNGY